MIANLIAYGRVAFSFPVPAIINITPYSHSRTQSPSYARSTERDEGLWPNPYQTGIWLATTKVIVLITYISFTMFLWFPVLDLARAPRRTARKKGSGYENDLILWLHVQFSWLIFTNTVFIFTIKLLKIWKTNFNTLQNETSNLTLYNPKTVLFFFFASLCIL